MNYAAQSRGNSLSFSNNLGASADAELVSSLDASTIESHIGALQDPAGHCSHGDNEHTLFCTRLREYAAATLASMDLGWTASLDFTTRKSLETTRQ